MKASRIMNCCDLASLQDRYDRQKDELDLLRVAIRDKFEIAKYQDLDSMIEIPTSKGSTGVFLLADIFLAIAEQMLTPCREYKIAQAIKTSLDMAAGNSSKDEGSHGRTTVELNGLHLLQFLDSY